jgi:carboxylate-amine ligase
MPPELPSWAAYVETMEQWMSADEVPDHTYVCWELRLQPRLGTIEVRVMDAQPSLARAAGLAALVQGLARHAVEAPDGSDLPDHVVLANDFRACRHGLEATVLDTNAVRRPMREIATEAVDDAARALAPDGLDRPLEVVRRLLAEPPEYTRQRELCALRGMPALLADLVARTTDLGG